MLTALRLSLVSDLCTCVHVLSAGLPAHSYTWTAKGQAVVACVACTQMAAMEDPSILPQYNGLCACQVFNPTPRPSLGLHPYPSPIPRPPPLPLAHP